LDARTKDVEAGILLSSPLVYASLKQIGELAIAKRAPLFPCSANFHRDGNQQHRLRV
jgi:putative tryptophan/tyrosine transport system substrate-binding protein